MRTKKALKAVALLMVAVCMLLFVPGSMTTKAEETATTYTVKYDESLGQFRMQPQYPWVEGGYTRELYYLKDAKDGDKLVVYDDPYGVEIKVTAKLSNVTLVGTTCAVIHAPSIDEVYVLADSLGAINGDVGKAYVYNNCKVNFNNNVGTMEVRHEHPSTTSVIVLGTVDKSTVYNYDKLAHTGYSWLPGGFTMLDGGMIFKEEVYSKTAPAATPAPAAPQAPADEYDDVPKTGETTNYFYLLGFAVIALFGASVVAKKVK